MPVDTQHPEYAESYDKWKRSRDCISGSDAVKNEGQRYLPKLGGQDNSEYEGYKDRALFSNVTGKTLTGFVGIITSKPPKVEYPPEMEPYFQDATLTSISFNELFKTITEDIFITGRVPLLVDRSLGGGRAYIVNYKAEQMINWNTTYEGGLLMSVMKEAMYQSVPNDRYDLVELEIYRALYLNNGVYTVDMYMQEVNAQGRPGRIPNQPDLTVTPTFRGEPIGEIPLTVITPFGVNMEVPKPPLLDIVDINLSHYKTSADLEQGRHWVSLPTPVVSGVESGQTLRVGSQTAWVLPNKDARAYYLEFVGQGLQSLEKALAEKHAQMTLFSAQLMNTSTRGSESADVIKLRFASDSATLSSIANAIESGLNRVYKTIAAWEGFDPNEVNISLNKDFLNTSLSAAEIVALTRGFVDGAIDEETFLFNLKRGDLVPHDKENLNTNIDRGENDAT